jgi:hypothetical protein
MPTPLAYTKKEAAECRRVSDHVEPIVLRTGTMNWAVALVDDLRVDTRITGLPGRDVDADLTPRLSGVGCAWNPDLELVVVRVLDGALSTPQEVGQIPEQGRALRSPRKPRHPWSSPDTHRASALRSRHAPLRKTL